VAAELAIETPIFDGEVVAADVTGRPLFYDLLRRGRPAKRAITLRDLLTLRMGFGMLRLFPSVMGAPEKRSLERAQRAEERSLGAASHEKC
jgi:hypothetical protein